MATIVARQRADGTPACVEDDDRYRIISVREATPKEVKNYVHRRQEW